ncbi:hypothetical protein NSU18_32255 [Paenibacillus sp. FSL H8-0048]|uniref:hypothetical protein n=1 Tax=Paenibacillus sp. FSL H8-0048 TaxID=2954508 RepID=UPI0030F5C081
MDGNVIGKPITLGRVEARRPNVIEKPITMRSVGARGPNVCGKQHTLCSKLGSGWRAKCSPQRRLSFEL